MWISMGYKGSMVIFHGMWRQYLGLKSRTLTWRRAQETECFRLRGNALTWRVAWIRSDSEMGLLDGERDRIDAERIFKRCRFKGHNRSYRLADLLVFTHLSISFGGCLGVTPFSFETSEASNGCVIQWAEHSDAQDWDPMLREFSATLGNWE